MGSQRVRHDFVTNTQSIIAVGILGNENVMIDLHFNPSKLILDNMVGKIISQPLGWGCYVKCNNRGRKTR